MSVNIPASDISRVNAAAGIKPVQVHKDVFTVIERAVFCAEITGGAFDPTVGPLVSLWGISSDKPRVPSQKEIDEVLPLINRRDVEIDAQTRSVFLKQRGMALDLGAIAKGFAADEAAAIIRKAGIENAIIDFGGNIVVMGKNQNRRPWRVGIQNPHENRGDFIGIVQAAPENFVHPAGSVSIVTSGMYERFFTEGGKRYHHIFSTADGFPIENELLAVTIIADTSIMADALSTSVFALGYVKGRELVESLADTEAVFIFKDNTVRLTGGVAPDGCVATDGCVEFTLTDDSFAVIPEHNLDDIQQVIDILYPGSFAERKFVTLSAPDVYFTVNAAITAITGFDSIEAAPVDLSRSDNHYTRIRFLGPGYFGITARAESGAQQFYSVFVSPIPSKHVDSPVSDFDWYHSQFNLEIGSASNCGPASASMAVGWGAGKYFPVSAVREFIGWRGDGGTSFEELLGVIKAQGVSASIQPVISVQQIIDIIDSGGIVIVLYTIEGIRYVSPAPAIDLFGAYYVDVGGHYIVIKGYSHDGAYFVVHDPIPSNWRTNSFRHNDGITEAGKNRYFSAREVINSLRRRDMIVVFR